MHSSSVSSNLNKSTKHKNRTKNQLFYFLEFSEKSKSKIVCARLKLCCWISIAEVDTKCFAYGETDSTCAVEIERNNFKCESVVAQSRLLRKVVASQQVLTCLARPFCFLHKQANLKVSPCIGTSAAFQKEGQQILQYNQFSELFLEVAFHKKIWISSVEHFRNNKCECGKKRESFVLKFLMRTF